jgi:hypothetical protein
MLRPTQTVFYENSLVYGMKWPNQRMEGLRSYGFQNVFFVTIEARCVQDAARHE